MLSLFLFVHYAAGTVALLSGYSAIFYKKGNSTHKRIGQVYLLSMLLLGLSGAYVAIFREVPLSLMNGLVICYFVLTGYNAMRKGPNQVSVLDKLLMLGAWVLTLGFGYFAYQTTQAVDGLLGGFGIQAFIAFGSVVALCAIADTRYVLVGGLSGKYRLTRHLWRMFFPLFMATAAFFLGQAKLLPKQMQSIEILVAPVMLVIITMLYWMVKTRFGKAHTA